MAKNFCSNCGNRLEAGDLFCGECGQSTKGDDQPTGVQYQQPQPEVLHQTHVSKPTEKKKSNLPVIIAGVVIVLLLVVGGVLIFSGKDDSKDVVDHTSDDYSQGSDQVQTVNDDKKVKATKPLSEMTTEDLMGEYDFFFVPEGVERESIQNMEKAMVEITYADGHHYMDFFDFVNNDTTWIDYEDGKLSGSIHTELMDIEVEGIVEIVNDEIVMSGRLDYQNYDTQETISGTWATTKDKLVAMSMSDENVALEKDDSSNFAGLSGKYEGKMVIRNRMDGVTEYFEERIGTDITIDLWIGRDSSGKWLARTEDYDYKIRIQGSEMIIEDMGGQDKAVILKGIIETTESRYHVSGTFEMWSRSDNNVYTGEWSMSQISVDDEIEENGNDEIVMTQYLYQPGYRYGFEYHTEEGEVQSYQLITFRIPGKTYVSFIRLSDGAVQQSRHYYIKDDSVYTYMDGNEANATFYMPLNPSVGDAWESETASKEIESIGGSYTLDGHAYGPLLVTYSRRLDGQGSNKNYSAPTIGFVKSEFVDGYQEWTELVDRTPLSDEDKAMIESYYLNAMY